MLKGACCWLADIVWLKDFAVEVQVNVGFILQVGYIPALHSLSGGRVICLKCFHIFSSVGLPPALRFLWAGASGSDMAATVAVSRTAANFCPDCLCGKQFRPVRAKCAKLVPHISPAWDVDASRAKIPHSFTLRKFRIPHDTLPDTHT